MKVDLFTDYYKILNIKEDCSLEELKKAHLNLFLSYNPYTNEHDVFFQKRMKLIDDAFRLLSNPKTRILYDKERAYLKDAVQEIKRLKKITEERDQLLRQMQIQIISLKEEIVQLNKVGLKIIEHDAEKQSNKLKGYPFIKQSIFKPINSFFKWCYKVIFG
jgi:curved DNA-binding protein CbpA